MAVVTEHLVQLIAKRANNQRLVGLHNFEVADRLEPMNHHFENDLTNSVVLGIAPLCETVPWQVAKGYPEELMIGNYLGASIGKQLRQKGLVK